MVQRVLLSGGTGLIGRHLSRLLLKEGYAINILSRKTRPNMEGISYFKWDVEQQYLDPKALEGVDYIIHLAGANIGGVRWTGKQKKAILGSRVKSAQLLFDTLRSRPQHRVKAFISASAIGYYGDQGDKILTEEDSPAEDFAARACVEWEGAAQQFGSLGLRTVSIRTGLVLSSEDGALPKLAMPLHFGIAPYMGSGQQYYAWIHLEDICRLYLFAIRTDSMKGAYNGTAPQVERCIDFMRNLKKARKSPALLVPAPAFALQLIFGESASVVLGSQRCSAEKIEAAGFQFRFPELLPALQEIYQKK